MAAFTAFDPNRNTAADAINAILSPQSGLSIVASSGQLHHGLAIADRSPFDGLTPEQVTALMNDPVALAALLANQPAQQQQSSVAFYDGSIGPLGIGAGLLLTSGIGQPPLSNTSQGFTGTFESTLGPDALKPKLQSVANAAFAGAGTIMEYSALSFQINVTDPGIKGVRFNVIYASDEYPEYTDSEFVDIAGVFVNGTNHALFNNNPLTPLSVVGANAIAGNVRDNNGNAVANLEYDGIYKLLSIVAPVTQGINTIEIGVADTGDTILDSALFISGLQGTSYTGFGLAPVVTPVPGLTQDQAGNQIFVTPAQGKTTITFNAAASGGDDLVDSTQGFSSAVFQIDTSQITGIQFDGHALTLITPSGTKSLVGVERIAFNNAYFALDTQPGDAVFNAFALLRALLGSNPNTALLSQAVSGLDHASSLSSFANALIQQSAPTLSTAQLVSQFISNLTGGPADIALVNLISAQVGTGLTFATTGDLLLAAAALDLNTQHIDIVGNPVALDLSAFL